MAWTVRAYLYAGCLAVPQDWISYEWFRLSYFVNFFMIHIGRLIKEELHRQEHTVAWFARKLYCDRTNIYKIFQKQSLDTEVLMRISAILHYDFFRCYSEELEEQSQVKE